MRVKRFVSLFLVLMLLIGTCAPVYADETIPGNTIVSEIDGTVPVSGEETTSPEDTGSEPTNAPAQEAGDPAEPTPVEPTKAPEDTSEAEASNEGVEEPAEGTAEPTEEAAKPTEAPAGDAEGEEKPTEGAAEPTEDNAESADDEKDPVTEPVQPSEPAKEPVAEPTPTGTVVEDSGEADKLSSQLSEPAVAYTKMEAEDNANANCYADPRLAYEGASNGYVVGGQQIEDVLQLELFDDLADSSLKYTPYVKYNVSAEEAGSYEFRIGVAVENLENPDGFYIPVTANGKAYKATCDGLNAGNGIYEFTVTLELAKGKNEVRCIAFDADLYLELIANDTSVLADEIVNFDYLNIPAGVTALEKDAEENAEPVEDENSESDNSLDLLADRTNENNRGYVEGGTYTHIKTGPETGNMGQYTNHKVVLGYDASTSTYTIAYQWHYLKELGWENPSYCMDLTKTCGHNKEVEKLVVLTGAEVAEQYGQKVALTILMADQYGQYTEISADLQNRRAAAQALIWRTVHASWANKHESADTGYYNSLNDDAKAYYDSFNEQAEAWTPETSSFDLDNSLFILTRTGGSATGWTEQPLLTLIFKAENEPEVPTSAFTLEKSADATADCLAQIQDNPMYSLAGAQYDVYVADALIETLITDANGRAKSAKEYAIGTLVTIIETIAPKGFKLDATPQEFTIAASNNVFSVEDEPIFDPPFALTKVDESTTTPQGNTSFSGAIFKWEYFANDSWSGTPARTWYFQTDENGWVDYNPDYLASGYTSDALYEVTEGNYQIPLGTVKITEVKNSLGYIVISQPLYCSIVEDPSSVSGATHVWEEESWEIMMDVANGDYGVYEPIDPDLYGSLIIDKVDVSTGKTPQGGGTLENAKFQVINNSTNSVKIGDFDVAEPGEVCFEFYTDANGHYESGAIFPLGAYTVKEAEPSEGYTLNTTWSQSFTVSEDTQDFAFTADNGSACEETPIKGGIQIVKLDKDMGANTNSSAPLDGITFSVINNNDNPVVVNGVSYSKGKTVLTLEIKWDGSQWAAKSGSNVLPYGSYIVKENPASSGSDLANDHYSLNTEEKTVQVQSNGTTVSVSFDNQQLGGLKIVKKTNTGENLNGWRFGVYTNAACTTAISGSPFTSGSDGTIIASSTLLPGTYYIKELDRGSKDISDWIVDTEVKKVTVKAGETASVTFNNTHLGGLKIVKKTNTGKDLNGWRFGVYTNAACTTAISGSPFTSGADGTILASDALEPGTYYVKELNRGNADVSKWTLDTEVKKVTVKAGETASVTFNNTHLGGLKIVKKTNTGADLDGWRFGVYTNAACTNAINGSPFTSASDGTILASETLLPGTYYVKELDRGSKNVSDWVLDGTVKTIEVKAGETASVTFNNTHRGKAKIIKETNTGADLDGWKFTIYSNETFTNVAAEITSEANGEVWTYLNPGTYWVKETGDTKDRFNSDFWTVDASVETITVKAGETATVTFTNTHLGKAKITKKTNTEADLDGWTFTIYSDENCTKAEAEITSDENGETFAYLEPGTYYVKETGDTKDRFDNEYWSSDAEVKQITVKAGEETAVEFLNTHYGKIALVKTVPEDWSAKDWEFQITRLSDNADMGIFTTDENGNFTTDKLLPGDYQVKELIPEDSVFYCKTENPVTVTVKVGETASVAFENALRPGSIEIVKVNGSNQKLADAKFLLEWSEDGVTWKPVTYSDSEEVVKGGCNTEGLTDGWLITDDTGVITFTNLYPTLQYRVTELEAPEGYILLKDYAFVGTLPVDTLEVSLKVVNNAGYKLPNSGVADAGLPTAIGAFLTVFGLAAMLFVFSYNIRVFNSNLAVNKKHYRKDMKQ